MISVASLAFHPIDAKMSTILQVLFSFRLSRDGSLWGSFTADESVWYPQVARSWAAAKSLSHQLGEALGQINHDMYINILAALRTGFALSKSSHRWDRELAQPSLTSDVPLVGPMQSQKNLNVKLPTQRETPNSTSPGGRVGN